MLRNDTQNFTRNTVQSQQQLLPWVVLTSVAQDAPDERMMWAQSGLNRMLSALDDMLLRLRQARGRQKPAALVRSDKSYVAADVC